MNKFQYGHAMALGKWKKQSTWELMAGWTKQNNESTVTRLEQRVHQTGSVKDLPRPGQPRSRPRPPLSVRTSRWGWIIYGTGFLLKRKRQNRQLDVTGGSVHVSGGITRHNRTRLVVFNRNVNVQCVCEWSVGTYCGSFNSCVTIYPKETVFCIRMVLGHIQIESHNSLLQKTASAYCIGLHCHQTCPQLNMFGMNLREGFMSDHTHP